MLGNAAPTPFDLRFSLFGIPVRVHPFFWVFSAMMGWDPDNPNLIFLWVACVFLSILVHELGHALMARYFGWDPEIVLYLFGGYASFLPTFGNTTSRAVATLLAGPGAGFVLYGIVVGVKWLLFAFRLIPDDVQQLQYLFFVIIQLQYINLWWGVINLLPVYPLDGGQISRELFMHIRPHGGFELALKLSLITAGAASAYFFMHHQRYAGILFAMLALQSLQTLQAGMYR